MFLIHSRNATMTLSSRSRSRSLGFMNSSINKFPRLIQMILFIFSTIFISMMVALNRITNLDVTCYSEHLSHRDLGKFVRKDLTETDCGLKLESLLSHPDIGKNEAQLSNWKFDYYGPDPEIQKYNPAHNPVLTEAKKTKVRLFTEVFQKKSHPMNECKHILYDGLLTSDVLDLQGVTYTQKDKVHLNDFNQSWKDDQLWVLDAHHVIESCNAIINLIKQTLDVRNQKPWMILGVDFGDNHDSVQDCSEVAKIIGQDYYRVAKRSIGVNRKWNEEAQFPDRGNIQPQPHPDQRPILHIPYPIRTDISRGIAESLRQQNLTNPLQMERSIDIAHFYKRQKEVGTMAYYDNLRNGVNVVLHFLESMPLSTNREIRVFAGLVGSDKRKGRNDVSEEYVKTMLQSKIIVVAQRDAWSDHYRLMEALSSGALVIADETLVLPRGLRDRESLVIFKSFSDLRDQLFFYLTHENERKAIAKRGWQIAMGYHRSWHAMEGVIFGIPITDDGNSAKSFQRDLEIGADQ